MIRVCAVEMFSLGVTQHGRIDNVDFVFVAESDNRGFKPKRAAFRFNGEDAPVMAVPSNHAGSVASLDCWQWVFLHIPDRIAFEVAQYQR